MPHIHEKYDFVVTPFIIFDDKVLLVNHPRYQQWIPMGGHIELDEDPEEALYREIKEETGLEVEIMSKKPNIDSPGTKFLLKPHYLDVHDANPPHKHIALIYFAKAKSSAAVKSDEHTEIKWFTETELNETKYKISKAIKFYSLEAIQVAKNWGN